MLYMIELKAGCTRTVATRDGQGGADTEFRTCQLRDVVLNVGYLASDWFILFIS